MTIKISDSSIKISDSSSDRLKIKFNDFVTEEVLQSTSGMPSPTNDSVTSLYFFYGWQDYDSKQEIRRRLRSSAEIKKAILDQSISYSDNWSNRENLNYVVL